MEKYKLILFAVLISAGIVSCSDDDDNIGDPNGDTAKVVVELTDAPGDYEEVLIEVDDVMIQTDASLEDEEADEEGWVSLEDVNTGVYDLLQLTGGATQLLADTELPAGKINQMRLVLGNSNSVKVDGVSYVLQTPSAQQSGLKLQINETLEAGEEYYFLLDFDVEQSIVKAGESGNYILKPVIRVNTQEAGAIIGQVHPTTHQSLVVATNGTVNVSAYSDEDGRFKLNLPEGTYMLTVTPDADSGYAGTTFNNVEVNAGEDTDMEIIFLEE